MSETKPTPRPWRRNPKRDTLNRHHVYGPRDYTEICTASNPDDADLIVAAVNAHIEQKIISDMVEAIELLLLLIQHETDLPKSACNGVTDGTGTVDEGEVKAWEIMEAARNAAERGNAIIK